MHSKPDEEEFVKTGFAKHRRQIMFNEYVILGPSTDPANIRLANSLLDAFRRLSKVKTNFVSRGDLSGTHKKELELWNFFTNGKPNGKWYNEIGSGMGAALNMASATNSFTLSDRGTWLSFNNKGNLEIKWAGDTIMQNPYGLILVNPKNLFLRTSFLSLYNIQNGFPAFPPA